MQPTAIDAGAYEFALQPPEDAQRGQHAVQMRGTNAHGVGASSNVAIWTR